MTRTRRRTGTLEYLGCLALLATMLRGGAAVAEGPSLAFEDVTASSGLAAWLTNWSYGHGASWGDLDGDGRPDLYVGAFADRDMPYARPDAPIPNMLFFNRPTGFVLSSEPDLRLQGKRARTTAAISADLNGDGRLDLVVANHAEDTNHCQSVVFENTGDGRFRPVACKGWPVPHATRNVAVYDFNRDGRLDVVLVDGNYANWRTGGGKLTVLENRGHWTFEDATAKVGFPADGTVGMGLAIGDLNDDGRFDFFVADCDRLFVSDRGGQYRECQPGFFAKDRPSRSSGNTCGAAFGDLDGDGRLDLVTTQHARPSRLHVYLNRGPGSDGMPVLADATAEVGLDAVVPGTGRTGLALKQAHVQIVDLDNDGRADILTTLIRQDDKGRMTPVALRNTGTRGKPRFTFPPLESLVAYYAPGPAADYDGDGRVDLFLPTWGIYTRAKEKSYTELDAPSYLFRNVSEGGRWLHVRVVGRAAGFNGMGIGATVRVYQAVSRHDAAHLIARRDIAVGTGYASGEEAVAYAGLGEAVRCDVVVDWQGRQEIRRNVEANQVLTVAFE